MDRELKVETRAGVHQKQSFQPTVPPRRSTAHDDPSQKPLPAVTDLLPCPPPVPPRTNSTDAPVIRIGGESQRGHTGPRAKNGHRGGSEAEEGQYKQPSLHDSGVGMSSHASTLGNSELESIALEEPRYEILDESLESHSYREQAPQYKYRRFQRSSQPSSSAAPVERAARPAPIQRQGSQVGGQLKPLTEDELNEKIKERRSLYREVDPSKALYINRLLHHLAKNDAELIPGSEEAEKIVSYYVDKELMERVSCFDPRFHGTLQACGSFYEGVKITVPNEFDYVLELDTLHQDQIEPQYVVPDTFKPRGDDNIQPRSYFKVRFREPVPDLWWCKNCIGCREGNGCQNLQLDSRRLQDDFRRAVLESVKGLNTDAEMEVEPKVKCSGPAVTVYMKLDREAVEEFCSLRKAPKGGLFHLELSKFKKGSQMSRETNFANLNNRSWLIVKIDITMGLPLENSDPNHMKWPLEGRCGAELLKDELVKKCCLVTSGDFWKISFSDQETRAVRDEANNFDGKKDCFLVLKKLRDDLMITDPDEGTVLGTYPLKVTFLNECQAHSEPENWTFWKQATRAICILKQVEQRGRDGRLTSLHVKDDPILMESDKCYVESRRIMNYLYEANSRFTLHGQVHTALIIFYWLIALGIVIASADFYKDISKVPLPDLDGTVCPRGGNANISTRAVELGKYVFGYMVLSIAQILVAFVGIAMCVVYYFTEAGPRVMYSIYKSVPVIYNFLFIFAVVHLGIAVRLAIGHQNLLNCVNSNFLYKSLSITAIVLSALVIVTLILHCVIVMSLVRCKCQMYCWEWVFSDRIWAEQCCCRKKNAPLISPPSVSNTSHANPTYDFTSYA